MRLSAKSPRKQGCVKTCAFYYCTNKYRNWVFFREFQQSQFSKNGKSAFEGYSRLNVNYLSINANPHTYVFVLIGIFPQLQNVKKSTTKIECILYKSVCKNKGFPEILIQT